LGGLNRGDRSKGLLHQETAALLAVALQLLAQEPLFAPSMKEQADGFVVEAVYGEQGRPVAGWLRRHEPRAVETLHMLEALARFPVLLATLLDAAGPSAEVQARRILARQHSAIHCLQRVTGGVQRVAGCKQRVTGGVQRVTRCKQQVLGGVQRVAGCKQRVIGGVQRVARCKQWVLGGVQRVAGCKQRVIGGVQRVTRCKQRVIGGTQRVTRCKQQGRPMLV